MTTETTTTPAPVISKRNAERAALIARTKAKNEAARAAHYSDKRGVIG